MQHTDPDDPRRLKDAIDALLTAPPAEREHQLRMIFVAKIDFERETGLVPLPGVKLKIAGDDHGAPRVTHIAQLDGVHVVWARIPDAKITTSVARTMVKALEAPLRQHLLVLSARPDGDDKDTLWHIIWPSPTDAKNRTVIRRMVIERGLHYRTVVEQLNKIGQPPTGNIKLTERIGAAFDVAPVTKEFFKTYRTVFEKVTAMIGGIDDPESLRLFCQTLFNRLMFVYFLQRKGWLSFNGDRNYLQALRAASRATAGENFYAIRLRILFFDALNNPDSRDLSYGFRSVVGDVPFLNGGLFEKSRIDEACKDATVPDEAFDLIFDELFERFNFTVSESTPYDIEVAVDPEMLGKVFEGLVTARHETGSYYTPRQVVAFMCREALKGYLETRVPALTPEAAAAFVDEHDVTNLNVTQATSLSKALDDVTVVDPACGSGAYLVGMLHELIELQKVLYSEKLASDAKTLYERKLHIIERNLYGADIDEFATNIAMLRLWLTLAIEFDGPKPEPLPNLDFKIAHGDSLTAPNPAEPSDLFSHAIHEVSAGLKKLRGDYMTARGDDKPRILLQIKAAHHELEGATTDAPCPQGAVDWRIAFAEVFDEGGFDVVIANPPYVRADAQFKHLKPNEKARQAAITLWKAYRERLKKMKLYKTLYEKWDEYIPFMERAFQLLRDRGEMIYIISDAYNSAKFTTRSHEFFLAEGTVRRIDFCSDIPLFEAGVRNTIVHVARATAAPAHTPIRVRRWGDSPDDFAINAEPLADVPQAAGRVLFRSGAPATRQTSAAFEELGSICYVSYGLRANSHDRYWKGEFVTADVVSKRRDGRHPKAFFEGKDVRRWWIERTRYLEWGTERAPAKFARPTFIELHESPEKLAALVVAGAAPVAYDSEQRLTTHTSCLFVPWHYLEAIDNRSIRKTARYGAPFRQTAPRAELERISKGFALKYVLAVMNSKPAQVWVSGVQRSKLHIYPDDWKKLPIPVASPATQASVVELVDEILALYREHDGKPAEEAAARLAELEAQIESIVDSLYATAGDVADSSEVAVPA